MMVISSNYAQDAHFSHPSSNLMWLSPSLTGSEVKLSGQTNFRNQWRSLGRPFTSHFFSFDGSLNSKQKNANSIFSVGILNSSQSAGSLNLKRNHLLLSTSCMLQINRLNSFSIGLNFGGIQQNIDATDAQWASQYVSGAFDPNANAQEIISLNMITRADVGAGIHYMYKNPRGYKSLKKATLALGAFHLNRPSMSILEQSDLLYTRWSVYSNLLFEQEQLQIAPYLLYQKQGPNTIFMLGSDLHFRLKSKSLYTAAQQPSRFTIGMGYRANDALICKVGFDYRFFSLGTIYDFTISSLKSAKGFQQALEFYLAFRLN
jgi:type IX secretion system PorP/SprF family membrane protein